jgi:hypothetical protein
MSFFPIGRYLIYITNMGFSKVPSVGVVVLHFRKGNDYSNHHIQRHKQHNGSELVEHNKPHMRHNFHTCHQHDFYLEIYKQQDFFFGLASKSHNSPSHKK